MLKRLTVMIVGCACLVTIFAVNLFNTNIQLAQGQLYRPILPIQS